MQGKRWASSACSTHALRVIVDDRAGLLRRAGARARLAPVEGEFDDYIARPKPNGLPVAAHRGAPATTASRSRCRSARARCTSMPSTASPRTGCTRRHRGAMAASAPPASSRSASPRRARPCCASCWPGSATSVAQAGGAGGQPSTTASTSSRRRPPSSTCPPAATPVDFAYSLHTDLGHRCRGARRRAMVPLNTARCASGQTVEVVATGRRPLAGLAQPRARLPARATARAPRCAPGSTPGARARPSRAAASGGKAAAARRPHGDQAGRAGRPARLQHAEALFESVGRTSSAAPDREPAQARRAAAGRR